eukprot:TRINITY_DN31320_c0_g1_i1.p1 TRINITY_DN31320_c0_g1~~TRINITY_DN31320_c0_g1_i1.p1  ORF type:complete len:434 (+),score=103.39 TRINITY_DN31320_c0_g1_i1:71-1372(+)
MWQKRRLVIAVVFIVVIVILFGYSPKSTRLADTRAALSDRLLPCSGRGRVANGSCVCAAGFSGPTCAQVNACPEDCVDWDRCPEYRNCIDALPLSSCPHECSGRGVCLRPNATCSCDRGRCGPDCSQQCSVRGVLLTMSGRADLLQGWFHYADKYFNDRFDYPVVVLYGSDRPFSDAQQAMVRGYTRSRVTFVEFDMSVPDWVNASAIHTLPTDRYFSVPYRLVMRFYSGLFVHTPELQQYDYWWRLDDDVQLRLPFPFDPFVRMHEQHHQYACPKAATLDDHYTHSGRLWMHTKREHLMPNKVPIPATMRDPFYWWTDQHNCGAGDTQPGLLNGQCSDFNLRCCNSHFELGDFRFFRSAAVSELWSYIDRAGGFFYDAFAWSPHSGHLGDHVVKGLALALFTPNSSSWWTIDLPGKEHNHIYAHPWHGFGYR